jgi:hypothetical protein
MKKFAISAALLLLLAICACGGGAPPNTITTTASGNWEAQLLDGTGPTSQMNFITSFTVTNFTGETAQTLDITGFGFYNAGACFDTGLTAQTEAGTATLNTSTAGQVTGSMTFTINSSTNPGTTLTLSAQPPNGGVNGTSNGTTTTTGTLTSGVVWGQWSLTTPSGSACSAGVSSGNFIMCQGATSCTIP